MIISFDELLTIAPDQLAICFNELGVDYIATAFQEFPEEDFKQFIQAMAPDPQSDLLAIYQEMQSAGIPDDDVETARRFLIDAFNEFINMGMISFDDGLKEVLDQDDIDALVGYTPSISAAPPIPGAVSLDDLALHQDELNQLIIGADDFSIALNQDELNCLLTESSPAPAPPPPAGDGFDMGLNQDELNMLLGMSS